MNIRCTLKKNSDFRRLYSKGKSAVTPFLAHARVHVAQAVAASVDGQPRLAGKLGHAVVRNRVRRRLREIYRLNSHQLKIGWDIVIVARSRCVGAEYSRMDAAFMAACEKLSLRREAKP